MRAIKESKHLNSMVTCIRDEKQGIVVRETETARAVEMFGTVAKGAD